jgi:2-polyprenyl-3-methyl-5-hydroxy-6-metoxy-1,4-benzoquinol methylase
MGVRQRNKIFKISFIQDYRLKRVTEFLKLRKGKLLDIGCGGGMLTEALQEYYPNVKIYGCDISSTAIKYAKERGSGKIEYRKIRNNKLPYKDNYFDACTVFDVMEHVPDVNYFLKEIRRVLKPNGLFFSHTPAEGEFLTHTWLWNKIGYGKNMTFKRYGHIHPEFSHKYLKKQLQDKKFKILKVNYNKHLIYQVLSLFLYFIPLEILELILKEKATDLKDISQLTLQTNKSTGIRKILIFFRNFWIILTKFIRFFSYWELDILKSIPYGALKINILASKS